VEGYADLAAPLMEKLKVGRDGGKKGSTMPIYMNEEERGCFTEIKRKLRSGLELQCVNPDKPFILRVDASGRAVGAALEQFAEDTMERPTLENQKGKKTIPVAFCSRKLTTSQVSGWTAREKETYAVVLALQKWASWIGLQPVLVLTDHKSLESWATEILDTPSGPAGRRARWHELLSKFDVTVAYIPGKDNVVADALSRWAYPASQAFADASIHGSEKDDAEMQKLIEEEKQQERLCRVLHVKDLPEWEKQVETLIEKTQESTTDFAKILKTSIAGVTTRRGAKTSTEPSPEPIPKPSTAKSSTHGGQPGPLPPVAPSPTRTAGEAEETIDTRSPRGTDGLPQGGPGADCAATNTRPPQGTDGPPPRGVREPKT
jgi:hypothetical protein